MDWKTKRGRGGALGGRGLFGFLFDRFPGDLLLNQLKERDVGNAQTGRFFDQGTTRTATA